MRRQVRFSSVLPVIMSRLLSVGLVGSCLLSATAMAQPAPAVPQAQTSWVDDVSFFGARTVAEDATAFYVTAGLPDVEIGAVHGLSTLADVTPRLRFQYGRGGRIGGGGLSLAAAFRMKFAEWSGWTIAVIGTPELALHLYGVDVPPTSKSGPQSFRITPFAGSLVADRLLLPSLRLLIGIETAVGFYVSPEFVLHTPLAVQIGAELRVTQHIFLLARFDTGFDYYSQSTRPSTETYLRARVGIAWAR